MTKLKTIAQRLLQVSRNRNIAIFACVLLIALASWAAYQDAQPATRPLASCMPAGAMLYIESPDFGALLHNWNSSPEKQAWLRSDNYEAFSRSRLFGRLGDAQHEFAAAAGLPPDMEFLRQIAGKESALGLYDIGALQFLYITHMPNAQSLQTSLMQERGQFETRKVGDATFYVRTQGNPDQGSTPRTVAFAICGDFLLLATREDLLAKALALMQNQKQEAVSDDAWFAAVTGAASKPGDLRMALDLSRVVPSPYFRSYWIQQNITEMGRYRAAISDLYRTGNELREERVLLPKSIETTSAAQADLGQLTTLVPAHTGFYRAQAAPSADDVIATLDSRLISRKIAGYKNLSVAPAAADAATVLGNEADLETRIDTPPAAALPRGTEFAALRNLFENQQPQSILVMDSSAVTSEDAFVAYRSAVVLESGTPWDAEAVGSALQRALRPQLTTGDLGIAWRQRGSGQTYFELDGMQPLEFAVSGRFCIFANDTAVLNEILQRIAIGNQTAGQPLLSASGFDHHLERANFSLATSLIDSGSANGEENAPKFFSKNIRSLSDAFASMQSEQFSAHWENGTLHQTVHYTWKSVGSK
jgi:hypothetical protein